MKNQQMGTKLNSGESFFAAYVGTSMNPTLREPVMLEIEPYGNRPLRVGDIVAFTSPENHKIVVHRIIRLTSKGIVTRGDNNRREDHFVLQSEDIKGRVIAVRHGRKKRVLAGGRRGRVISRFIPWIRRLDRNISYLLYSIYHSQIPRRLLGALLPAGLRPKIVVFENKGIGQPCILLGRRIIGRYDYYRQQWQIRRPFRLIVDVQKLSVGSFKQ